MLRTLKKAAVLLVFSSFFLLTAPASADSFTRNLKIGALGDDVLLLQQLLNRDSRTQIAAFGPGAPGNETRVFGPLTRSAVIRFQEVYADEVLRPVGLTRGTGFVGPSTIKKLQTLSQATQTSSDITLITISPGKAEAGEVVELHGFGFTEKSTVVFDGAAVAARFVDTEKLQFRVPNESVDGFHPVVVRGEQGGVSNMLELRVSVAGGSSGANGLGISRLAPARGGYGTTVTITGNGFTQNGNTLTFGFSRFTNLSSPDGKTLTLQIPRQLDGLIFTPEQLGGTQPEIPLGVMVTNSNGESNTEIFTFTFYNL